MEEIVFTTMEQLTPPQRRQLGRYRHTVFVEELQWELPLIDPGAGEEWDEFDRDDTTCVIAYAQDRNICGYARLLPTTRPYLLSEVFPDLCRSPPPGDPRIWELSRLTTFDNERRYNMSRMCKLLHYIFIRTQDLGIRQLIGVAPASMERLYRRLGLVLQPISPLPTAASSLAAFSLDINAAGLRALSDGPEFSPGFFVEQTSCEPELDSYQVRMERLDKP
jgi:acyl homoserine lactone synthase